MCTVAATRKFTSAQWRCKIIEEWFESFFQPSCCKLRQFILFSWLFACLNKSQLHTIALKNINLLQTGLNLLLTCFKLHMWWIPLRWQQQIIWKSTFSLFISQKTAEAGSSWILQELRNDSFILDHFLT